MKDAQQKAADQVSKLESCQTELAAQQQALASRRTGGNVTRAMTKTSLIPSPGEDADSRLPDNPGSSRAVGAQRGQSSRGLVLSSGKQSARGVSNADLQKGQPESVNPPQPSPRAGLPVEQTTDVAALIKASYQSYRQHAKPKGSAASPSKVENEISEENSVSSAASAKQRTTAVCNH